MVRTIASVVQGRGRRFPKPEMLVRVQPEAPIPIAVDPTRNAGSNPVGLDPSGRAHRSPVRARLIVRWYGRLAVNQVVSHNSALRPLGYRFAGVRLERGLTVTQLEGFDSPLPPHSAHRAKSYTRVAGSNPAGSTATSSWGRSSTVER